MNPHRLILELVDAPKDDRGDPVRPKERWFLKLRRDAEPDDPWGMQIPVGYSLKCEPVDLIRFAEVAIRYLIHHQPSPAWRTLDQIPETAWNEVFEVRKYGPRGGGTTDDTAAMQEAIDTACPPGSTGSVYFPPGHTFVRKPDPEIRSPETGNPEIDQDEEVADLPGVDYYSCSGCGLLWVEKRYGQKCPTCRQPGMKAIRMALA